MGQITDIREYKNNLRARYRTEREQMPVIQKASMDADILSRFLRLYQYREAETLLTYVSTPIEVDTRQLIDRALADGKRVAVPRCERGTRNMDFYYIRSANELSPGTFGVLEPLSPEAEPYRSKDQSICVVPAFCFDFNGYRLGYGKGYYDRFLSRYHGFSAGLCYSAAIRHHLLHGRFDCPVELIVTERYIRGTAPSRDRKQAGNTPKGEQKI